MGEVDADVSRGEVACIKYEKETFKKNERFADVGFVRISLVASSEPFSKEYVRKHGKVAQFTVEKLRALGAP